MCQRCGGPLNTGKVYCSRRCALYAKRAAQRGAPKPKAKPKPKTPANRAGVVSSEYLRNRATLKARAQRDALPCWVCGQPIQWDAQPRTRWSFSADHRTPRSKGGTSALANLVQAHYGCNSRRGDGTRQARTTPNPQDTAMLTVITGPPCAGKTTYVQRHAKPGDIIIDYDKIAQALGSPDHHDHPPAIRYTTKVARDAAIRAAIGCHQRGATVWIIDGDPGTKRRQQYARAGAKTINVDAPVDELHRRATADRPARWHELINQWATAHRMIEQTSETSRW